MDIFSHEAEESCETTGTAEQPVRTREFVGPSVVEQQFLDALYKICGELEAFYDRPFTVRRNYWGAYKVVPKEKWYNNILRHPYRVLAVNSGPVGFRGERCVHEFDVHIFDPNAESAAKKYISQYAEQDHARSGDFINLYITKHY